MNLLALNFHRCTKIVRKLKQTLQKVGANFYRGLLIFGSQQGRTALILTAHMNKDHNYFN